MKIYFPKPRSSSDPVTNEPRRSAAREPGRWVPLLIFVVVVVLALDYHLFVFR
jgi:hypothetical protein